MPDRPEGLSTERAVLELNARLYHYDRDMDPLADLVEQGPDAYAHLSPRVLDLAVTHKQFRDYYREAVAAGAVADDRGPTTD